MSTTDEQEEVRRRARGRRHARQARARSRRRRRRALLGLAIAMLAAALVVGWLALVRDGQQEAAGPAGQNVAGAGEQTTLLFVRHSDRQATGVTLLATGPEVSDAIVFVPTGTLVDVPGFGPEQLGLAFRYGGSELVAASVENALGISIDDSAAVSDAELAAFLGRTGGLSLTVVERLVERGADGTATVRFTPGPQLLDGRALAQLWEFRERGEEELDTFSRQQLVWAALLDAVASDSAVLDRLLDAGAPQLQTHADAATLRSVFEGLATARSDGTLTFTLLPVEPFSTSSERGSTYRLSEQKASQLVADLLAASVPAGGGGEAVRVQVLNGVGQPGIGQEVDRRLDDGGFRIVLSDNARSFDFTTTRILVYEENPRMLAAARRVRDRLGVGSIAVSRQPQSVVDLTIVVGADFLARRKTEPTPEQTP